MLEERQIRIIPTFTGYKEGTICFETGADPANNYEAESHTYQSHALSHVTGLRALYERVLLGDSFPSQMILRDSSAPAIMAATLFMYPNIILLPECSSFVNSVDMISRLGISGYAHIPEDHRELLLYVGAHASDNNLKTLMEATTIIYSYVTDYTMPNILPDEDEFHPICDIGSILVFTSPTMRWDKVFSTGYLGGIGVLQVDNGLHVEARIKSGFVRDLDLNRLTSLLNKLEWEGTEDLGWKTNLHDLGFHTPLDAEGNQFSKLTLDSLLDAVRKCLETG